MYVDVTRDVIFHLILFYADPLRVGQMLPGTSATDIGMPAEGRLTNGGGLQNLQQLRLPIALLATNYPGPDPVAGGRIGNKYCNAIVAPHALSLIRCRVDHQIYFTTF